MGKIWLSLSTVAVVLLLVCGPLLVGEQRSARIDASKPAEALSEHVIMISIDGLVPDYYTAPERVGLRAPGSGKYVGSEEDWNNAQRILVDIVRGLGMKYTAEEGEALDKNPGDLNRGWQAWKKKALGK